MHLIEILIAYRVIGMYSLIIISISKIFLSISNTLTRTNKVHVKVTCNTHIKFELNIMHRLGANAFFNKLNQYAVTYKNSFLHSCKEKKIYVYKPYIYKNRYNKCNGDL